MFLGLLWLRAPGLGLWGLGLGVLGVLGFRA